MCVCVCGEREWERERDRLYCNKQSYTFMSISLTILSLTFWQRRKQVIQKQKCRVKGEIRKRLFTMVSLSVALCGNFEISISYWHHSIFFGVKVHKFKRSLLHKRESGSDRLTVLKVYCFSTLNNNIASCNDFLPHTAVSFHASS